MKKFLLRPAPARVAFLALMLVAAGLISRPATLPAHAQATTGVLAPGGQRGVAFVHTTSAPFGSPASYESLKRLHDTGANWVSIVTPFRQHDAHAIEFYRSDNDPTDSGIAQMIIYAHSLGMRVMVQPIVLADDGVWNGFFAPNDTARWFANYRDQVASYAALAQSVQADEFCVGTEFFTLSTPQYSQQWREVISAVRMKYFGPLTYSANWGDKKTPEYATIDWWDALDFIGISAYFPLSWNNFLTEPLTEGWRHYRTRSARTLRDRNSTGSTRWPPCRAGGTSGCNSPRLASDRMPTRRAAGTCSPTPIWN